MLFWYKTSAFVPKTLNQTIAWLSINILTKDSVKSWTKTQVNVGQSKSLFSGKNWGTNVVPNQSQTTKIIRLNFGTEKLKRINFISMELWLKDQLNLKIFDQTSANKLKKTRTKRQWKHQTNTRLNWGWTPETLDQTGAKQTNKLGPDESEESIYRLWQLDDSHQHSVSDFWRL